MSDKEIERVLSSPELPSGKYKCRFKCLIIFFFVIDNIPTFGYLLFLIRLKHYLNQILRHVERYF